MLDDLILLRLWAVRDSSPGEVRSKIVADLRPFAANTAFDEVLASLVRNGFVLAGGRRGARLQLTDAGRAHVHNAFRLPADATDQRPGGWTWWRDRYAVPRALGVRQADTAEALRTALLRRLFLPELSPDVPTGGLAATVDLLLARQLRTPQATVGAFRTAALRDWVKDRSLKIASPEPVRRRLLADEAEFAAQVRVVAQGCATGRFGNNKVFISHVWNALLAAGRAASDEERSFKERLVRANIAGRLRLSRADLAGAHDARDVRASEVPYLGEVFHFLRLD